LIVPLGKRIIRLACSFLKRLESSGIFDKVITINISAIQLKRDDFLSDLLKEIAEVNVNACNITLEITESVFSDNFQIINEKLGAIWPLCGRRGRGAGRTKTVSDRSSMRLHTGISSQPAASRGKSIPDA
jgi:predicted signal transduction protein with EAL and GGDEF domain